MTRKLKPDRGIQGLVPAIISLVIFFCTLIIFGYSPAFKTLGSLILIYSVFFGFWPFYKTGNTYFFVSGFYLVAFSLVLFFMDVEGNIRNTEFIASIETKLSLLFVYLFMIWLIYIVTRKKLKWRGREIMELAAWDVEPGPDTYTERPRPVGKLEMSKYDVIDFSNYLKKNLVCMPFEEENRILLLPVKMGEDYGLFYNPSFDYLSKTWISFNFDGNVSVHISRLDYLDFREDLSFDQLCDALGKLMITFAEFYLNGSKIRILDRIDSVKTGIFS